MRPSTLLRASLAVGTVLVVATLLAGGLTTAASSSTGAPVAAQENASAVEDGYYSNPTDVSAGDHEYRVELEEGERLYVGVYFADEDGGADLTLVGPGGDEVGSAPGRFGDAHLAYNATQAGTYSVYLHTLGSLENYDLEVRTGTSLLPRGEPNSHWGIATPLLPGDHEGLEIRHPEDDDFYAVYVEQGQTLEASIGFAHSEADLDLVVYGGEYDGQFEAVAASRSSTDDESVTYTPEDEGIYYVGVRLTEGAPATYDLSLSLEGGLDREAWGDTSATETDGTSVTPIGPGTYANQSLQAGLSSGHAYAFRARSGDRINVSVTEHTGFIPPFLVTARQGNFYRYDDERISFEAPHDGIYVFTVGTGEDQNSTYTLTLEGARPWSEGDGSSSEGGGLTGSGSGLPGFGIPAAIVALLVGLAIARRS